MRTFPAASAYYTHNIPLHPTYISMLVSLPLAVEGRGVKDAVYSASCKVFLYNFPYNSTLSYKNVTWLHSEQTFFTKEVAK